MVNGSKVRERLTKYILAYMMNLPSKTIQIDETLNKFNNLLKSGKLSLYDKAHLAFSLHSFDQTHTSVDTESAQKIMLFASDLEGSCQSDPQIAKIIWGGEALEEEQVIRGEIFEPYGEKPLLTHKSSLSSM